MKNCFIGTTIVCLTVISSIVCIAVPTPPEILETKCYKRSALLFWSPTGSEPVNEYKIQYKTNWNPNEWFDYGFKVPLKSDMKDVRLILSPWANYTFRIVASNHAGSSNHSSISDYCVTEEDVPHKNPDDVFGRGNGPNNLVITWKPMPPIEQNAPGFLYTVYWRLNDDNSAEWHHRNIHDWQQHRLLIENLPKLRPYRIKVEAYNSLGKSAVEATEVIGFSDEDKPSEEPKFLKTVAIIDGDSAKLEWGAVPPKSINGHFKGYKVEVWTDSDANKTVQVVAANITTAVIDLFTPGKKNYALVRAFNGAFDGPESNTVSLDMPKYVYPDPPSFSWTRIRDQNNKAVIRITLEPNMTNNNPGQKIYIQYRKKGMDIIGDTQEWENTFKENVEGTEQTSELVNLDFEVFYEVRVAAQSGNLSSFSNISKIDTHSNKWPKPTTTTTPSPPTTPSTQQPIIFTYPDGKNPDIPRRDPESQEDTQEGEKNNDENEEDKGSSKTPWLIALIVLVVFIFIFVGVFIYIKQRKTGAHQVNRKPHLEPNNTVTTNANNGNGPIRPNEMDSFIVIDNNPNGSVGHDEGDDEPDDRQRDVYQGTTESHH